MSVHFIMGKVFDDAGQGWIWNMGHTVPGHSVITMNDKFYDPVFSFLKTRGLDYDLPQTVRCPPVLLGR